MLLTTRGLVLKKQVYNDSKVIVSLLTECCGVVSYLVPLPGGARGKRAQMYRLIYPLSELLLEVEHREGRSLQEIREAEPAVLRIDTLSHPVKSSITFFLAEVLWRILRGTEEDTSIYTYISDSLEILEHSTRGIANFHIVFLYQLLHQLGLYPTEIGHFRPGDWFDLGEARFVPSASYGASIPPHEASFLPTLCRINYSNMSCFRFSVEQRRTIIDYLLLYYSFHLNHFGELSTLQILTSMR